MKNMKFQVDIYVLFSVHLNIFTLKFYDPYHYNTIPIPKILSNLKFNKMKHTLFQIQVNNNKKKNIKKLLIYK